MSKEQAYTQLISSMSMDTIYSKSDKKNQMKDVEKSIESKSYNKSEQIRNQNRLKAVEKKKNNCNL